MAGALVVGRVVSVRYFAARLGLSVEDVDYSSPAAAAAAATWLGLVVIVAGFYGAGIWLSYRLIHWLGGLRPISLVATVAVPAVLAFISIGALPISTPWKQLLASLLTIFVYGFITTSLVSPLAEIPRAISGVLLCLLLAASVLVVALLVMATRSMIDDSEELADHARTLAVAGAEPVKPSSVLSFSIHPVRGVAVDQSGTEHCVVRVTSTVFLTMADELAGVRTLVMEPSMFFTGWQTCDAPG